MTLVDWLLTEELLRIFGEARAKQPGLNLELESHSPHGEEDVLAGAGIAVRIDTTDGGVYLLTPRRLLRMVGDDARTVLIYPDLIGYDWISPEMSEKVAQKAEHFDRLFLYRRTGPRITLDHLGQAVYPLLTFFGRVLEYQSEKVLRRKLDDDLVDQIGRSLSAAARGPFFTDAELEALFGRSRESMQVVAAMWPRLNLAAPELRELVERVASELIERSGRSQVEWREWIGAPPQKLEAMIEVFRRVSSGEV